MRALIAALLIAGASPALADGPAFWLVDTIPGAAPTIAVVDDFEDATACYQAAMVRHGPGFATCVALDEFAEVALSHAVLRTMGEE
ncbi:exported hypothetical protein [uncultured Pleomorphomonas sp.]|uniref:Secreted protein n=1 Tax=uncultured Pleomorphomonas sp. TaxID=442121 RepID=A0A212LQS1_9HYPH|nr:hypothetical protein [uncultured Pleomorphomonas sp.]SCM79934.1 exported hypothetical protein [uncultured Pleomorphomonas sp.]